VRRVVALACAAPLLLEGCAAAAVRQFEGMPLLPAATFGAGAERTQRLTVMRDPGGEPLTLDAAVEIDATEVRMAGFLLGQRVILLSWDGNRLAESREPAVPAAVQGRSIMRDLQLVYWPATAVRSVLPRGCRLSEESRHRQVVCGDAVMVDIERRDDQPLGAATLHNRSRHYRIAIEAAP